MMRKCPAHMHRKTGSVYATLQWVQLVIQGHVILKTFFIIINENAEAQCQRACIYSALQLQVNRRTVFHIS
jgi:hypothetical protein